MKEGVENDPFIASTLLDMCAKGESLIEAQFVFDELSVRDTVTWTTLLSAYSDHGLGEKALICLDKMQLDGIIPDEITFVSILKACGSIQAIDSGLQIHAEIIKEEFERDIYVRSTLVGVYHKSGFSIEGKKSLSYTSTSRYYHG